MDSTANKKDNNNHNHHHHRRRGPRRGISASAVASNNNNSKNNNNNNNNNRISPPSLHQHHHGDRRNTNGGAAVANASPTSPMIMQSTTNATTTSTRRRKKLLLLHGARQTGEILLHRIRKLQKRLDQPDFNMEIVAPDAPFPHPDDHQLRQWWERHDNEYRGLEDSLTLLQSIWNDETKTTTTTSTTRTGGEEEHSSFCGILGFSQGARLAHLIALLATSQESSSNHENNKNKNQSFPGLQFVILVAGYDAPIPDGFNELLHATATTTTTIPCEPFISIPSLHVWGTQDTLIVPEVSQRLQRFYRDSQSFEHGGGHFVPMKTPDVEVYVSFIQKILHQQNTTSQPVDNHSTLITITQPKAHGFLRSATYQNADSSQIEQPRLDETCTAASAADSSNVTGKDKSTTCQTPSCPEVLDDDTALAQQDEVEALAAIFPDEFTLISKKKNEDKYVHPIVYRIALTAMDGNNPCWPPHPLTLQVRYPATYPGQSIPDLSLIHDNNVFEFSSSHSEALLQTMREAAEAECGMPCILSCVYAAREWLEAGPNALLDHTEQQDHSTSNNDDNGNSDPDTDAGNSDTNNSIIAPSSTERKLQCTMEGLEIAYALLGRTKPGATTAAIDSNITTTIGSVPPPDVGFGKGGSWAYTIGLVGKPSAGKSTFFNAATAFARQRDDADNQLGGATMAPHPFTTIDPNIGYCLIPAPPGSCPEEEHDDEAAAAASSGQEKKQRLLQFGSTHGRDSHGRRLIPVMLKDVAGLVPGAYQGRGRGNKFLNDLTDADVLIHVVDASGTADSDGNTVTVQGQESGSGSHPLEDLAWIRQELIEWVFTNIVFKWLTIRRRGRWKLSDMFSGYKQSQSVVWDVLLAVEKHLERTEQRDKALDKLETWDEGDLLRLVSAFLGVRFPMALALNKADLPQAESNIRDVQNALPVHGAHVGVPLSAQQEMLYIRHFLEQAMSKQEATTAGCNESIPDAIRGSPPEGVWECLQSAMTLREPVLVFPVSDMTTYAPLTSLNNYATLDASLPNMGMIACLQACGGCAPTCWDSGSEIYVADHHPKCVAPLRDVMVMKPGSSVEDVFLALKRMGALGGEFVRAEGARSIGEKPKLVPKQELVGKHNRILKIMTNKRRDWQKK